MPPPTFRGACHVFLSFDVSESIDLVRAETLLRESASRPNLPRRFHTPEFIAYQPPPLRVAQSGVRLRVGLWEAAGDAEIRLFDFGAASVAYRIPFETTLDDLAALSDALQSTGVLREDARARAKSLCDSIAPAVVRPGLRDIVEDYAVFRIDPPANEGASSGPASADAFFDANTGALARVLRGDPAELSPGEVREATAARLSYTHADGVLVDWAGAVVIDAGGADVLGVLEFANVELLELRVLDLRLDQTLEASHRAISRQRWWGGFFLGGSRDLRRLADMQTDNALLFEGVNNAIKLVGDQYLARLYRLASQRLGVPAWQAGVTRKLTAFENVYAMVSDRAAALRMEMLEWIIVLLIAFEVVMSLAR